jgi:hypothetical protein
MRVIGLVVLAVSFFAAPLAVEAQQAGKVYRIGYISPGIGPVALTETFRESLREYATSRGGTSSSSTVGQGSESRWQSSRPSSSV